MQEEGAASELPVLAAITNTHQAANGREDVRAGRPWDVLEGARRGQERHTLSDILIGYARQGRRNLSLFFSSTETENLRLLLLLLLLLLVGRPFLFKLLVSLSFRCRPHGISSGLCR